MKNYAKIALLGLLALSLFAACEKEKENEKPYIPLEPELQADFTETAYGTAIEMVYVKGGEFMMGATAEQGDDAYDWEKPVRTVRLDSYHIGKYEVTQAQWKAVMGTEPSSFEGENRPVGKVSRGDAKKFCEKLSAKTGKKYVLPTEAQWEYAARGGKKSRGYKYAGSNTLSEVAWYSDNSYALGQYDPDYGTHAVGTKKANELGIYDMSGNVEEWCADYYGSYDVNDTDNPTGPQNVTTCAVVRGGCWVLDARGCRVSYRRPNYHAGYRYSYLGFRVAMIP
ncbi:MAG: formylglycine-generating enzyme family protein [Bacteroides sp.]|nr:formylglycine-generating enzyme family protein [Bacteroides sp.]MCM1085292.1 formylglycine-generating enzyme family protein [Bacteroides sp.]